MNQIDPSVLLAVFQEMLGPLLWLLLAAVPLGALAFAGLLIQERGVVARRLLRAQALGPIGGALALALMARVSSSGFADAAGPIDWLVIALVFIAGLLVSTVAFYTAGGWWAAFARSAEKRRRGAGSGAADAH